MTTWVAVRGAALTHNAAAVRHLIGDPVRLCAVVKANGYGHDAVLAARAFLAAGAERLAVTTCQEALELRAAGLTAPVQLLASCAPDEATTVVEHELIATVSDAAAADRLAVAAQQAGRTATVHVLVDCGMGRDGVLPAALGDLHQHILATAGLRLEGVYTHFPNATAADRAPTRAHLRRFLDAVSPLRPRPPLLHAANSAATVDLPEARLDLVRVGTLLYGQYPSEHVTRALDLQPTWTLHSRLVEVRRLPAGSAIGYGSEVRLPAERLVGTLLVGWQQGFGLQPESLASGWRGAVRALRRRPLQVTIRGVACPVLGRLSMQSCCVDVTAVPEVVVGDVAVVPARRVTLDRGVPRVLETAPE